MANLIQLRRDLSANWADVNPVLSQGEPGVELDSGKIKIGNGVDPWNDLDYSNTSDLPPDAEGYLVNDGSGNLSWTPLPELFSGQYDDLVGKPDIPRDANELSDVDGLLLPPGLTAGFDFGTIANKTINSKLEWILNSFNYDNGTINSPANIDHDAGTLI